MRTYQCDSVMPGFLHGSLCIAIQVVLAVASACCPGHKPCLIRFNIPALLLRWARDWALCTPSELTPGKVHMWQNCCLIRLSSKADVRKTQVAKLAGSGRFASVSVIEPSELEARLAQLLAALLPKTPKHHLHVQIVLPAEAWDKPSTTGSTGTDVDALAERFGRLL